MGKQGLEYISDPHPPPDRTSSLMRRCFSVFVLSSSAVLVFSRSTDALRSSRSVSQLEDRLRWLLSSCCSFSSASDSCSDARQKGDRPLRRWLGAVHCHVFCILKTIFAKAMLVENLKAWQARVVVIMSLERKLPKSRIFNCCLASGLIRALRSIHCAVDLFNRSTRR